MKEGGNRVVFEVMDKVFEVWDMFEWCGLGEIFEFGLKIIDVYFCFDVEVKFYVFNKKVVDVKVC